MGKAKILHTGFYSSIQDRGRLNYRHLGVPHSGSMDQEIARNANALLGNLSDCAVLEMILQGIIIQFSSPTYIAIMGKIDTVLLNGKEIEANKIQKIAAHDILKIGRTRDSNFMYLAVCNGWQTEKILGSRSMSEGITSLSSLKLNQELNYQSIENVRASLPLKALHVLNKYEVYPGPEYNELSESWRKRLTSECFQLSNSWNRMAYTFITNFPSEITQIKTAPVIPGTIQLTPSGNLIVLMRDAQSTGGYPRILQMEEKELNRLVRIHKGSKLKFCIKHYGL